MEETTAQPLIFLKQYGIIVGLLIVGLGVFGYGLMQFFGKSSSSDVTFQTQAQADQAVTVTPSVTETLTVDIEGAVLRPGVYKLDGTARLQDLVVKAGGLIKSVDHEKVAKGL